MAAVLGRGSHKGAVGDDREVTAHLDDRFASAVHDPDGLGTHDLGVGITQQLLRVLPSDLPKGSSAAPGNKASAETDREEAEDALHHARYTSPTPRVSRDTRLGQRSGMTLTALCD